MIINKIEAMKIAKENNEYEVAAVGNLHECWEVIGDVPMFHSANIYRVDETEFNGERWGRNKKILVNERGEYWYYVLRINGKLYQ